MVESNWLWCSKSDTYLGIILQLDGITCKVGRGSNPHPNLHLTPSCVHADSHCHTQPQLPLALIVILVDCNCFLGVCIWRRCVLMIVFRTTQKKNTGVLHGIIYNMQWKNMQKKVPLTKNMHVKAGWINIITHWYYIWKIIANKSKIDNFPNNTK